MHLPAACGGVMPQAKSKVEPATRGSTTRKTLTFGQLGFAPRVSLRVLLATVGLERVKFAACVIVIHGKSPYQALIISIISMLFPRNLPIYRTYLGPRQPRPHGPVGP